MIIGGLVALGLALMATAGHLPWPLTAAFFGAGILFAVLGAIFLAEGIVTFHSESRP
jgi:integral membrane sensor domain MASE1